MSFATNESEGHADILRPGLVYPRALVASGILVNRGGNGAKERNDIGAFGLATLIFHALNQGRGKRAVVSGRTVGC